MVISDANYILRYLLNDIEEQFLIAKTSIENDEVFIHDFIVAEVVYVLEKVYSIQRKEIKEVLENLLLYPNILLTKKKVILKSLELYSDNNIDYSDALLIGYFQSAESNKLLTFDKGILKIIEK